MNESEIGRNLKEFENFSLDNYKEMQSDFMKLEYELEPFLDGVRTKSADYDLFKQAFLDFRKRLRRTVDVMELIGKGGASVSGPQHSLKDTLYNLFAYMGLVESLGNTVVDIVVMLLVANGRDFHIECQHTTPRVKHAIRIKDLETERVPLSTKLNFLQENGVKKLASTIDSRLRNIIAHLEFEIKGDTILIRGKPSDKFILGSSQTLLLSLVCVINALWKLAKEKGFIDTKKSVSHE